MEYTVHELERLEFPVRFFRGYDREEVDRFLEDITRQTERMVDRIAELEDRVHELEDKLEHYENLEDSIKESLMLAQQTREDRIAQANREAEEILREARREEREVKLQINQLEASRDQFAMQFYALLRGFASQLANQFPELAENAPDELPEPPVDSDANELREGEQNDVRDAGSAAGEDADEEAGGPHGGTGGDPPTSESDEEADTERDADTAPGDEPSQKRDELSLSGRQPPEFEAGGDSGESEAEEEDD